MNHMQEGNKLDNGRAVILHVQYFSGRSFYDTVDAALKN